MKHTKLTAQYLLDRRAKSVMEMWSERLQMKEISAIFNTSISNIHKIIRVEKEKQRAVKKGQ